MKFDGFKAAIPWIVATLAFVAGGLALLDVERQNRDTFRAAAYRFCSRDNVHRAQDHSEAPPKQRRFLEMWIGEPILDCTPNLEGHGARPLSLEQQRDFVRRWETGKVSLADLGVCPDSEIGVAIEPDKC